MKLRVFSVLLIVLPAFGAVAAQETFVDDALLEEIATFYAEDDGPGVVVFVDDNGETFSGAAGVADLDTGEPITVDAQFRIGSVTKPMVSAVLLSLVETGDVNLDGPIADYLPAEVVNDLANADEATVRQMLQMTSGIP
ncbi:MAG: serine hydrolase domain-containing protein, partial [Chloroflexota bacterium]